MSQSKPLKLDAGKWRPTITPTGTLRRISAVMEGALDKYDEGSWVDVEPRRYIDALMRHVEMLRAGEYIDPDSGLPTVDHILTNAAIMSWMSNNGQVIE